MFEHGGTHIDAPNHYVTNGKKIAELPVEDFIYHSPLLLDIPKEATEKVTKEDLLPYAAKIAECDLLLIRTGFFLKRVTDQSLYEEAGPSVSSLAAKYLVENFGGKMKAIALDFISLSCPKDTKDGNLAHQYLLGGKQKDHICIIEDVNLGNYPQGKVTRVSAIPLFMEVVDSSPVTMFVESE
jgi:kynurenine formamidase